VDISLAGLLLLLLDLMIRLGLSLRVILRRLPVGVTLAWLGIILMLPLVGAVAYLLFGELRLGSQRARRLAHATEPFQGWLRELDTRELVDWSGPGDDARALAQLSQANLWLPALPGNRVDLLKSAAEVFPALIADIDRAQHTCHLEFYIWSGGGLADEVAQALCRAAGRGVECRVLLDAVGSWEFLRGPLVQQMTAAGVRVREALPAGLIRMLFVRFDLRLHRKIVVIDGQVAYTGSMNLVDPQFFKQSAGVGQWVDAMARVEGPAVEAMTVTLLEDWIAETGDSLDELRKTLDQDLPHKLGTLPVQVLPSGPSRRPLAMHEILLMAIYTARRELILTTPYFVPDEALLTAITSAARRGVNVTLIMPARVDSKLVRLASQANLGDLAQAGVRVALFDGGLLHTKSVTIDRQISLFGTVNLDPRSLHLNFEVTLAIYDRGFTEQLRDLQRSYLEHCQEFDLAAWQGRAHWARVADDMGRLIGPLL
jgi:cardiolipin synthase